MIKTKETYNGGKLDGDYIEYFIGGTFRGKGNMKSDSMNGKWTFWYHNGEKELECELEFGNPVGNVKIYHDNGVLKEVVTL